MARKKSDDAAGADAEPANYTVRIDPALVPRLKMVSAALSMTAPNYINSRLEAIIERELAAAIRQMGLAGDRPAADDARALADPAELQARLDQIKPLEESLRAAEGRKARK